MYSVIRFNNVDENQGDTLTALLNSNSADWVTELKRSVRNPRCFSFSLSMEESWAKHHEHIFSILKKIAPAIVNAKSLWPELHVQLDLEVGHPDYSFALITEIYWTVDMLLLMAQIDINLVISIYNPNYTQNDSSET